MKVIGKMGASKSQSDFYDGKNSEAHLKLSQKIKTTNKTHHLNLKHY